MLVTAHQVSFSPPCSSSLLRGKPGRKRKNGAGKQRLNHSAWKWFGIPLPLFRIHTYPHWAQKSYFSHPLSLKSIGNPRLQTTNKAYTHQTSLTRVRETLWNKHWRHLKLWIIYVSLQLFSHFKKCFVTVSWLIIWFTYMTHCCKSWHISWLSR